MKKQGKKLWTNKEVARLRKLVKAGKSDEDIALLLGRSKCSVFHKRKYSLRIDIRKHWTDAEDARLKVLLTTTDKPISEIAKQMNRTESSIERRKERLGIRRVEFNLDKHSPIHVAQLVKFKLAGWTHKEIADVWGIRFDSQISNVLRFHGFHRFCACVGKKEQQLWSEVETHLLRKYLKKGMSLSKIYRKFPHRSPSSIGSKARAITKHWRSIEERMEDQKRREKWMKWRVY